MWRTCADANSQIEALSCKFDGVKAISIFFFILSPFLIPIFLWSFKNKISHIKIFFKDLGKFLKVSLYFCKFQKYEVTCGILLAKKRRSVSTEVCLLLSRKSNFFSFPREMFFFFILSWLFCGVSFSHLVAVAAAWTITLLVSQI